MPVLLHTEDLQKLCRICFQFPGKGSYCKEKHQECRWSIQKTTIPPYTQTKSARNAKFRNTAAFKNWTEYSVRQCHICDRIRLFQKGVIGTQKFGSKKKRKGRPKAKTKDSFSSQSFFDSLALQIKSIIPATVTLQEVNNEDLNPMFFFAYAKSAQK